MMPLFVNDVSVITPESFTVFDVINVPELSKLVAVTVLPVVPCIDPLLVTAAALIVNVVSANNVPLFVKFSVLVLSLSAILIVVCACNDPLLVTVPLLRIVTLPASAVITPALFSQPCKIQFS
jgi:hypothetical protein